MIIKNNSQIQVRIDIKTKEEAQKIFEGLGLDMSSAIKLFFRQTINSKNLPFEIRDENGFSLYNAGILRESIISAKNNPKSFKDGSTLLKNALDD